MVDTKRKAQPKVGCRKLLNHLLTDFRNANIKIGRDKFYRFLRQYNLLVPKL